MKRDQRGQDGHAADRREAADDRRDQDAHVREEVDDADDAGEPREAENGRVLSQAGREGEPTATKSKTFQPSRKKRHGRGRYDATRSAISTTKKVRKIPFSRSSVSPKRRSSPSTSAGRAQPRSRGSRPRRPR
jgi:hypothetical protein